MRHILLYLFLIMDLSSKHRVTNYKPWVSARTQAGGRRRLGRTAIIRVHKLSIPVATYRSESDGNNKPGL